jgi:hypothetical protein
VSGVRACYEEGHTPFLNNINLYNNCSISNIIVLTADEVKDEQKDDTADVQMQAVASVIKDRLRKKTKKTKMQKEMAMEMN